MLSWTQQVAVTVSHSYTRSYCAYLLPDAGHYLTLLTAGRAADRVAHPPPLQAPRHLLSPLLHRRSENPLEPGPPPSVSASEGASERASERARTRQREAEGGKVRGRGRERQEGGRDRGVRGRSKDRVPWSACADSHISECGCL
eukprot:3205361-Rhodomonas_salina.1